MPTCKCMMLPSPQGQALIGRETLGGTNSGDSSAIKPSGHHCGLDQVTFISDTHLRGRGTIKTDYACKCLAQARPSTGLDRHEGSLNSLGFHQHIPLGVGAELRAACSPKSHGCALGSPEQANCPRASLRRRTHFPSPPESFPFSRHLLQGPLLASLGTLLELLQAPPSVPSGEGPHGTFRYGLTAAPFLLSRGSLCGRAVLVKSTVSWKKAGEGA